MCVPPSYYMHGAIQSFPAAVLAAALSEDGQLLAKLQMESKEAIVADEVWPGRAAPTSMREILDDNDAENRRLLDDVEARRRNVEGMIR